MADMPLKELTVRLRAENPWWAPPYSVGKGYLEKRPRAYLSEFLVLVRNRGIKRAVVLLGPRRVGKTVLIHQAIQALLDAGESPQTVGYVSADLPLYHGVSLEKLLGLLVEAAGSTLRWVFIDEIQYLDRWEVHLKRLVDDHSDVRIVVSGSAAAALRVKSRESGAGRFTDFLLPPLAFAEYLDLTGEAEPPKRKADGRVVPGDIEPLNAAFLNYINFGGYPESALNPAVRADPSRFIKSDIVDKVLLRDLPQLYGIGDTRELNQLFARLAWGSGRELSLDGLASSSGVAKNTIKKYLEYLEAAFLIRIVHRVDRDARRFQRATTYRVHLVNPSIRSALFAPVSADDAEMGCLAETTVIAQWFHDPEPIHYARWSDKYEVDQVRLSRRGTPAWAAEIKWSDRYVDAPEQLKGLLRFAERHKLERVTATTRTRTAERAVSGVTVDMLPTSIYAWQVGDEISKQNKAAYGAGG